jgi:hypothetical protein
MIFDLKSVDVGTERISDSSEILAHMSWSGSKDTLHFLIKKGQNSNKNWKMYELFKASITLANYHSIYRLCHGLLPTTNFDHVQELNSLPDPEDLELSTSNEAFKNRNYP